MDENGLEVLDTNGELAFTCDLAPSAFVVIQDGFQDVSSCSRE